MDKAEILGHAQNLVQTRRDRDYQIGVLDMTAVALELDENGKFVLAMYLDIGYPNNY